VKKEEVLAAIANVADVQPRVIDSATPRVTFIGEGNTQLAIKPSSGSRSIPLSAEGSKNLLRMVGMTDKMRTDLSGGTFQKAASELLAKKGQFTVLTKEGVGVDFLGGKHFQTVEPERALRTMEQVGIQDFHRVYTQERAVVVQALGDRVEPVVKGDRVQAGASVTFSPVGTIAPLVQSFSVVLACTNGMTMQEVEESFTFTGGDGGSRDPNGFWEWFRKELRAAYGSIDVQTRHFREMREHHIAPKDRAGALEGVIRQSHLPEGLAEAVRARALEQPPRNAWDLMNLVTWGTTHATDDYQVVRRSHKAMSTFAHNVAVHKVCPICRSSN